MRSTPIGSKAASFPSDGDADLGLADLFDAVRPADNLGLFAMFDIRKFPFTWLLLSAAFCRVSIPVDAGGALAEGAALFWVPFLDSACLVRVVAGAFFGMMFGP
jgi:hypothetical protein